MGAGSVQRWHRIMCSNFVVTCRTMDMLLKVGLVWLCRGHGSANGEGLTWLRVLLLCDPQVESSCVHFNRPIPGQP